MRVLIQDVTTYLQRGYYCFYGDGTRKEFLLHVVSRYYFLLAFASFGCFVISDKYFFFAFFCFCVKVLVVCLFDLLIFGLSFFLFFFFFLVWGFVLLASFHDCVFSCGFLHEELFLHTV